MKLKDPLPATEQSVVVYSLPCKNCEARYFGETGRRLGTRLHEQQLAINRKDKLSLVYGHVQQINRKFAFEKARVIGRANEKVARLFGGGVESTIIYGPTSPLPRYASVNVTFRGFGRSFNLLEVGYRSEFGGKLRHALLNEPEEMPSVHDAAPFPYQAQNFTFYSGSDRRSSAFVRLFGHEVFLSMDADEDFKGLYPAKAMQSSLLEVDEIVSLPTVGGLSLQVAMLGVSSQKLKYDLNWTGVLIDFDARLAHYRSTFLHIILSQYVHHFYISRQYCRMESGYMLSLIIGRVAITVLVYIIYIA
ncbi:unnamed protein product [Dibothriocephalus latus]|uniref:Vitellinogen open beta-sheet domain-containing protein n=1 Tax=Dibothriocephalus latus TaxID=60516 RepID=A0A3P7LI65_DIBLA|nr:unnamed protein product [Dibothriocephalus latus]